MLHVQLLVTSACALTACSKDTFVVSTRHNAAISKSAAHHPPFLGSYFLNSRLRARVYSTLRSSAPNASLTRATASSLSGSCHLQQPKPSITAEFKGSISTCFRKDQQQAPGRFYAHMLAPLAPLGTVHAVHTHRCCGCVRVSSRGLGWNTTTGPCVPPSCPSRRRVRLQAGGTTQGTRLKCTDQGVGQVQDGRMQAQIQPRK